MILFLHAFCLKTSGSYNSLSLSLLHKPLYVFTASHSSAHIHAQHSAAETEGTHRQNHLLSLYMHNSHRLLQRTLLLLLLLLLLRPPYIAHGSDASCSGGGRGGRGLCLCCAVDAAAAVLLLLKMPSKLLLLLAAALASSGLVGRVNRRLPK
jgi:hypothetical protein